MPTSPESIQVWVIRVSAQNVARWRSILTGEERERALRFRFAEDQDRFTVTRGILRHLLGRKLNLPPTSIEFTANSHGKPAVAGIEFNASHSGDYALIALAQGIPVGIDVERIGGNRVVEDLARRVLTPAEYNRFTALPPTAQFKTFFQIWTLKESVLKAMGSGLSIAPETIEISFPPEEPRLLTWPNWTLRALEIGDDQYAAAIAVPAESQHIEIRHFRIRDVNVLPAETEVTHRPDGTIYVRSPRTLGSYPVKITERLEYWAQTAPDRIFLARRGSDGNWIKLSFAQTLTQTRAIAQALLHRNPSVDRPIAILSGNSLEHALLALAAMYIGVPYAPLSPSYSFFDSTFQALRSLFAGLQPGLVFADDPVKFGPALRAVSTNAEVISTLPSQDPTAAIDDAHSRVNADTIAKLLYTSGSTGQPKGVINTQRMLCSNQQMLRTVMYFLADEPPVLCDWLPWNHTFGGNHNFGIALYNGGTLYIDDGRPTPGAFDATLRNLKEIATTAYFNVPKGFEMLIPPLKQDPAFRKHFFSRLNILFYAAAGLKQSLWNDLQELALESCGEEILMVTGLGATESSPFALSTTKEGASAGQVGLPVPGVELKLAPAGQKMEARLRGPNITPGYWSQPALTAAAFDEEGFYRMGDALLFADPADPLKGFVFDGRLAEDFKMSSGTWVSVGPLRTRFLTHFLDVAQDVVFTAPDRDFIGALVFPKFGSDAVRSTFEALLKTFAATNTGSSTRVERIIVLTEPASMEAQEITDKGSINQKQVLKNRAHLVEELYQEPPSARVISLSSGDKQ